MAVIQNLEEFFSEFENYERRKGYSVILSVITALRPNSFIALILPLFLLYFLYRITQPSDMMLLWNNMTFWLPVYIMNDTSFQSGNYLIVLLAELLLYFLTAVIIVASVKTFMRIKLFHRNMNEMMAVFLFQWLEAIVGKIVLIPYQIGYFRLNASTQSYVSWWSEDIGQMIGVDGQSMHVCSVLLASFLVWHYAYSMIFGILNLGVERIFATIMLRDYELETRSYIPIILLVSTHLVTLPFSVLVLTNKVGFYVGTSPCFINSAIAFLIFALVWKVNHHRRRLMDRPGCDYSVSQHFQIKENYRALKLARNLLIVVLCAMSVPCALLIMLEVGWLSPFEMLIVHIMENAIFLNPIIICSVLMSSAPAWRAAYFRLFTSLGSSKLKISRVFVVTPKPIELQPRESVTQDEGNIYFEELNRAWS